MLDQQARRLTQPLSAPVARILVRWGASATMVTAVGWVAGVAACFAVATQHWHVALGLWIVNRVLDGLDGAIARLTTTTDSGGFLDIMADFSIYAGFVFAIAIAVPEARLACTALLVSYYVSGSAFLALSSLLERRKQQFGDDRSLRFVAGLAEGTETIAVYVVICLWPSQVVLIAWLFAGAVLFTALQRLAFGLRVLRETPAVEASVLS